jgi:hypothetical protein
MANGLHPPSLMRRAFGLQVESLVQIQVRFGQAAKSFVFILVFDSWVGLWQSMFMGADVVGWNPLLPSSQSFLSYL